MQIDILYGFVTRFAYSQSDHFVLAWNGETVAKEIAIQIEQNVNDCALIRNRLI